LSCKHNHAVANQDLEGIQDPSKTKDLQNAYIRRANQAYNSLKEIIKTTFLDNQALVLDTSRLKGNQNIEPANRIQGKNDTVDETTKAAVAWIILAHQNIILDSEWQNEYVRRSYIRGAYQADQELKNMNITLSERSINEIQSSSFHKSSYYNMINRNMELFATVQQDLSDDLAPRIKQVLTRGYTENWTVREMARQLENEIQLRIDKVGKYRARMIARTETVRANTHARTKTYIERGVSKVYWILSHAPCPICQDIASANPYRPEEIFGLFPAHPNEMCSVSAGNPGY